MSTVDDNGEGIIGQYVFIGGKPHAVLETDHSLSVFPQVDVTTCVLPLSEHKRGRRPPPTPPLSPLQIRTTCPPSSENRAGPHWTSSEGKSASCLDKRRASCMKRAKGAGILAWAWPLIFLIRRRKLLLQRTLSQSICTEDWGSYGSSRVLLSCRVCGQEVYRLTNCRACHPRIRFTACTFPDDTWYVTPMPF